MRVYIETERLYIRPLGMQDEQGMFEMDSDPEVHKYLRNNIYNNIEQSREMIAFVLQQYEDFGIGRWAVIEKGTDDFVGWTGFKFMKGPVNKHSEFIDFGYRQKRKHWGKGYATEAGKAALHYGIGNLHFKDIYAMTDTGNLASMRVLEKVGLKYIETFNYDATPDWRTEGQPTTWYKWMG